MIELTKKIDLESYIETQTEMAVQSLRDNFVNWEDVRTKEGDSLEELIRSLILIDFARELTGYYAGQLQRESLKSLHELIWGPHRVTVPTIGQES